MFLLYGFDDTIQVQPEDFDKNLVEQLKSSIITKYVDRVVANVGLVVAFSDFLEINEGTIHAGDGAAHFKVSFRLVVFKPFEGEVITGRIQSCDKSGIKVTLGFFEDVKVLCGRLMEPMSYDDTQRLWVWNYTEENKLFYDLGEIVRFRVSAVCFNKAGGAPSKTPSALNPEAYEPPMTVLGAMDAFGLGVLRWWNTGNTAGGEDESMVQHGQQETHQGGGGNENGGIIGHMDDPMSGIAGLN
uniref:RNA polymerase III subunit Rpc25 domain-containing protein n=1 Tax=Chromera velia CCMP2878 TaxID=1169474 RepID=A0A0G4I560_9ALVE|mmetsp:Transcript_4128/g.8407  ORF Transcript_4128/g.8407 Transcript_4128/m.8407 type:complete len:243 (-) Transcript_4128:49-777(-)|eukprot:Cvel_11091.t1-p1 / transcript=Cvel_11091.t1 / gene=Cvel_11091 / organism=Chromera_velia_CCMP2878 / gene_product=DNA-directed RNA polymerase III subunit rpc8, putative / transcript_product=DNA-directed RNA polymerase III subunit rpc8, putative / location=Cvel_scaffold686:47572-50752(-) / protein_length=242 / sequence_SO=supercontig / SO=protein_coding / is_pseudo=false